MDKYEKKKYFIGSKLLKLRHKQNLKQIDLADILKVHINTIKNYEKNEYPVPLKHVENLISLYNLDVGYIKKEDSIHTIDVELLGLISNSFNKIVPHALFSYKYGTLIGIVYNSVINYRNKQDLLSLIEKEILHLLKLIEVVPNKEIKI